MLGGGQQKVTLVGRDASRVVIQKAQQNGEMVNWDPNVPILTVSGNNTR